MFPQAARSMQWGNSVFHWDYLIKAMLAQLFAVALNRNLFYPHIFLGHLLNQAVRIGRQPGTTATVTGFEFPEEAKALPVPPEQGIGFNDQESRFPVLDAAGDKDKPEAIGRSETRLS